MNLKNTKSLLLLFGLISLGFSSCRKEKTSWESDWVVPIFNDTLSLENLENDSTLVINSSTLNYEVDLTRTIANFGLADIISIEDTTIIQDFNLSSGSLSVPPGYTIVNQIEEHDLNVDGIELKKIRVKTGQIVVTVFNPLVTDVNFDVTLPGVIKDGVVFNQNYSVPAHVGGVDGTATATLDISGYWIDLTGEFGNSYNKLQSQMNVQSSPTGPTVTLSSSQLIKIQAKINDISMDYAKGYFGNTILSDTLSTNIDFLNAIESGTADLPGTSLRFDIENGMKLAAKAILTKVENTNNAGNAVALSSSNINAPFYLNGATGTWGATVNTNTQIEFNPGNSNLENYLENLGKTHTIGYQIQLNPWGNTSGGYDEIFPDSRLKVKLHAELPLSLGTNDLTLVDTFELNINQEEKAAQIVSGKLSLNYTNAFPFSGDIEFGFLDEYGAVLHTVVANEQIQSSVYGLLGTDGLWRMKDELEVVISETVLSDLALIKNVLVRVRLNSPNVGTGISEAVAIPGGAFLGLKLKAGFKLNVNL
ncbi:MAG: hypothetical protein V4638_06520 [Bacteroidota bacterium]